METNKRSAVIVLDTLGYRNLVITIPNESQRYENVINYTHQNIMKNLSPVKEKN